MKSGFHWRLQGVRGTWAIGYFPRRAEYKAWNQDERKKDIASNKAREMEPVKLLTSDVDPQDLKLPIRASGFLCSNIFSLCPSYSLLESQYILCTIVYCKYAIAF